jgi:hypothetical protein
MVAGFADPSKPGEDLMNWLKDQGFKLECMTPACFGNLRGMMATATIHTGDLLFAFPMDATMDLGRNPSCPCPQLIDAEFWETSDTWYVKMALWLVAEEAKGSDSQFAEYIKYMPSTCSSPNSWSNTQVGNSQNPTTSLNFFLSDM